MKSSRLRGAALAWGAILASGTAYAQYPYPVSYAPYAMSPAYQTQYGYPPRSERAMHLPPTGPVNLAGPSNYANPPQVPATVPMHPMGTVNYSNASFNGLPTPAAPIAEVSNSVLAMPVNASQEIDVNGANHRPPEAVGPGPSFIGPDQRPVPPVFGQGQHPPGYGQQPPQGGHYGRAQNGHGMAGGPHYDMGGAMGGPTTPPHSGFGNGMGGGCYEGGAGACGDNYCAPAAPSWYVGAYGLWLSEDARDHYTFSFDTANESRQLTDSKDIQMDWEGGFAVAVGHYFNCGCNAFEAVYWGWYPDDAALYTFESQVAGDLNGIHNWNSLTYNGVNAATLVDNARVHALFRETEVHNVELNLLQLGNCGGGAPCAWSPLQYSFVAGARFFRFDDRLIFGADTSDAIFDGDNTEIFYDIRMANRLYGLQLGGVGSYSASPKFSLNGGVKVGLFLNDISLNSEISGPAGIAVINNGPFNGRGWIVRSSKDDVSFLGEIFLGGSYAITPRWSLTGGYRAVAITGLALPSDQIYADLRGINDVASIESNSSVILHGGYLGAQFCF